MKKVKAEITLLTKEEGGREKPIDVIYKPSLSVSNGCGTVDCKIQLLGKRQLKPGETGEVELVLLQPHGMGKLEKDMRFGIYEGLREVGKGKITRLNS